MQSKIKLIPNVTCVQSLKCVMHVRESNLQKQSLSRLIGRKIPPGISDFKQESMRKLPVLCEEVVPMLNCDGVNHQPTSGQLHVYNRES